MKILACGTGLRRQLARQGMAFFRASSASAHQGDDQFADYQ
jgi:hypothetical protein